MRVFQLLEAIDFSPLTQIWQGAGLSAVIRHLQNMGEDEKLLADLIKNAKAKAETAPEKLIKLINPIMDVSKHQDPYNGWQYSSPLRAYLEAEQTFLNAVVATVIQIGPAAVKTFASAVDLAALKNKIDSSLAVKLELTGWKNTRSKKDQKFDKDNQLYVFIGRPTFKEEPGGKYHKTLEIENLLPIDRFNSEHHRMVGEMQLRATQQGENSKVYMITLPVGVLKTNEQPPDWLIPLIDERKTPVR